MKRSEKKCNKFSTLWYKTMNVHPSFSLLALFNPCFFSSSKNQLLIDANHSSFITTWNSNLLRVDKKQQKFSQIMNYLPWFALATKITINSLNNDAELQFIDFAQILINKLNSHVEKNNSPLLTSHENTMQLHCPPAIRLIKRWISFDRVAL